MPLANKAIFTLFLALFVVMVGFGIAIWFTVWDNIVYALRVAIAGLPDLRGANASEQFAKGTTFPRRNCRTSWPPWRNTG